MKTKRWSYKCPASSSMSFWEDKFVDLLRKILYKVIGEGTKLMYNVMVDKSSRKTVDLESTQRTIIPQKQVMDKRDSADSRPRT